MSWASLALDKPLIGMINMVNGPTNSQAVLRLFGQSEKAVRVTLYRDKHAWCPYCQKVWLWLEEKQIPYRIRKVTMFCYGDKESWYKRIVPSGMLPALELDAQVITESDSILQHLETAFGPLGEPITARNTMQLRGLERALFRAWCQWLCYPVSSLASDALRRAEFERVATEVEAALASQDGDFFLGHSIATADLVFVPYVERMAASLYYYKGYRLRDSERWPRISAWFNALEQRPTYRGTQSDFHTHAHDLPPQMGGCYAVDTPEQRSASNHVDHGPYDTVPDVGYDAPSDSARIAFERVMKHKAAILAVNPHSDKAELEAALLCAMHCLLNPGDVVHVPPPHTASALRYLRDRISVPRDMPIHAARALRTALEAVAMCDPSGSEGLPIPVRHRRDQNPVAFEVRL